MSDLDSGLTLTVPSGRQTSSPRHPRQRPNLWMGPNVSGAHTAYATAIRHGMTAVRAMIIAQVGSFRDCWAFARHIAAQVGCSRRTVQRATAEAKSLGILHVHRSRQTEAAPGLGTVVPCGWSHRWLTGADVADDAARDRAIAVARAAELARRATTQTAAARAAERRRARRAITPRRWTAEEIDAELARRQTRVPGGAGHGPSPPE